TAPAAEATRHTDAAPGSAQAPTTATKTLEFRAPLVIAADGRWSKARAEAGLAVRELHSTIDVWWFRIDTEAALPDSVAPPAPGRGRDLPAAVRGRRRPRIRRCETSRRPPQRGQTVVRRGTAVHRRFRSCDEPPGRSRGQPRGPGRSRGRQDARPIAALRAH